MKVERRVDPFNKESAPATQKLVDGYLKLRQRVQDVLDSYKSKIVVKIEDSETPFRVFHVGDTHLSHDAAKPDALSKAIKEAGDNGLVVLQGNIIESVSNKFLADNTSKVGLNLDQQKRLAASIIKPADEAHRVIPVSGNKCHEGWPLKTSTHDPTPDLVSPETPVLFTGGQIEFQRGNKPAAILEVYHNPGEGQTNLSPEGSARARSRETPVGHPDRPDAVINAHTHMLVAGQDVMRNPVRREDVVTTLGVVGTAKGTKEHPDRFLISLGVATRNQPADAGEGLVTIWKKGRSGKLDSYPVASYDRAGLLYEAEDLWEDLQRTNSYDDLREQLQGKYQSPKVTFKEDESPTRTSDKAAKSEGKAPQYKTLFYQVASRLPVRIQFIANLRVGSASLERDSVRQLLREIEADPWAYCFATRRLINQGVAMSHNRESVLRSLANLLAYADSEDGQKKSNRTLLGIMITDELHHAAWSREMKEGREVVSKSMYPGDWLFYESPLKGIPLIMPETVVFLKMPSTTYTLYLRDKLSHFTSLINPEHGLTRISQVWGIEADALIGGHTEVVGWRTWMRPWGQLEVVVPGGFSEYIEKGIGNRVDFPRGGQGIIMFPDKKLLYSFATASEGRDMHEALWMLSALKGQGMLEKVKSKLKKSK